MTTNPFDPQKTFVILLGASNWPKRKFDMTYPVDDNPFQRSVSGIQDYFEKYLRIPKDNFKNLFDSKENANCLLEQIEELLTSSKAPPSDVFIYYVGHGTEVGYELSLAIPIAKSDSYDLPVKTLWRVLGQTLEKHQPPTRCYFLFDACFSGKITELPTKTSLGGPQSALFFCSAPPGKQSFVGKNEEQQHITVFTEALLKTLRGENPHLKFHPFIWSFREIQSSVKEFIKVSYPKVPQPLFYSCEDQIENLNISPLFSSLIEWSSKIHQEIQRRNHCQPIRSQVKSYLSGLATNGIQDQDGIEKVRQLDAWFAKQLSDQELVIAWQGPPLPVKPNYLAWSERLQQGRVVIFLGKNVPDTDISHNLTSRLQKTLERDTLNGSLSELCEYTEMATGRERLCQDTVACIESLSTPAQVAQVELYQLLAQANEPLVLISSEYTYLLDQALAARGKKFVVLSPSHDWENSATRGKVWLRRSDAPNPMMVTAVDLNCEKFLTEGYFLIYKIRGCVKSDQQHLLLSQNDYVKFACHSQWAIPNELVTLIKNLEVWFIGHHPKTWEDRLLIQTILQQCQRAEGEVHRMALDQGATDFFIGKFWEHQNVVCHHLSVTEWVRELKKQLSFQESTA